MVLWKCVIVPPLLLCRSHLILQVKTLSPDTQSKGKHTLFSLLMYSLNIQANSILCSYCVHIVHYVYSVVVESAIHLYLQLFLICTSILHSVHFL